jgi:UPF0271 protein
MNKPLRSDTLSSSTVLLNCDIGESFGAWAMGMDAEVMPFIDCANIACGFHAGDPSVMRKTVRLALDHGVTIGAHPAYPDLMGFGRRSMKCSPEEIRDMLHYQLGALQGICRPQGGEVSYVKPHGALYNDMMANREILKAVLSAVREYDSQLAVMILSTADNSDSQSVADELGVTLMLEAFADRAYTSRGFLVSRAIRGSSFHEVDQIIDQATRIASGMPVTSLEGAAVHLKAHTLCVHGDNQTSIDAVQRIRVAIQQVSST